MIPADVRLFTWLDVEGLIARTIADDNAPHWFLRASAYWNELTVTTIPGGKDEARNWIRELFDPRAADSDGELQLILESTGKRQRLLPVSIEESDEPVSVKPLPPSFHRPRAIEKGRTLARPSEGACSVPIAVFHSFKGGVGRTTHAIGLAIAAASSTRTVLLVDADLEAPGISWLMRTRLPEPSIAFADLLALAHGDSSQNHQNTIDLAVNCLQNSLIDGCFILPAFRNLRRLPVSEVRPEDLIIGQSDPFILTQILTDIGKRLNVGLIIVDLRAGYSELAAGLLLDPRVHRIFVTTLSGQALEGTLELLNVLGARSPSSAAYQPYPAVIVNQVPEGVRKEDWPDTLATLIDALSKFAMEQEAITDDPVVLESPFDRSLQMVPADWEETIRTLKRSGGSAEAIRALIEWLPLNENIAGSRRPDSLEQTRSQLRETARAMIFAETRVTEQFLNTHPIRALAGDNISHVPISIVIGAKGSGKTFTFLQQVRIGSWKEFVRTAIERLPDFEALLASVLYSTNLQQDAIDLVNKVNRATSTALAVGKPMQLADLHQLVRDRLSAGTTAAAWREVWLDCIAWSVGFQSASEGAGRALADKLDQSGQRLIGLFDGLEDLFQDVAGDIGQQIALRALLQDLPLWLAQRPTRNLGLLVFIRRDLASLAVKQNYAQFFEKYRPYALQWDRGLALGLASWLMDLASGVTSPDGYESSEEELKERLIPLWGKKLGADDSREARSAEWILNALSDYNKQIQARDLVRFIHVASEKSLGDSKWTDRALTPLAIRDALPECSREKVTEIKKENEELKRVFDKLEAVPYERRILPFDASFADLSKDDFRVLEDNGALFNDGGAYYIPEIYLHALGFVYSKPGRRRVLSNRR